MEQTPLQDLIFRSLLGRDPGPILDAPFAGLSRTERALVLSVLSASCPGLDPLALTHDVTWDDIEHWLAVHAERMSGYVDLDSGRRAVLRPVEPSDVPTLFAASFDPERAHRWRFRGRTQSYESFAATMDEGVLVQYATCTREDRGIAGLVVAYNADLTNGHAYLGILRVSPAGGSGLMIEGAALLLRHLWNNFPLRHVYFELVGPNRQIVAPLVELGIAEEVGLYEEHSFGPNGYEDLSVYRMAREQWEGKQRFWFSEV